MKKIKTLGELRNLINEALDNPRYDLENVNISEILKCHKPIDFLKDDFYTYLGVVSSFRKEVIKEDVSFDVAMELLGGKK